MSLKLQGIKHNPFAWRVRCLKTRGLAFIPTSSLPSQVGPATTKLMSPEHLLLSKTTNPACSGTPLILTSTGASILCFLVCTLASKCYLRGRAKIFIFFIPTGFHRLIWQWCLCLGHSSIKALAVSHCKFYWGTVDLQRCVSFRYRAKWLRHPCCCSVAKLYPTLLWPHGL